MYLFIILNNYSCSITVITFFTVVYNQMFYFYNLYKYAQL